MSQYQKHLHARGEDLRQGEIKENFYGNTSTHVERTFSLRSRPEKIKKHLHARGEDLCENETACANGRNTSTHVERTGVVVCVKLIATETPPRTWRGLKLFASSSGFFGNTSTHVERTTAPGRRLLVSWKHLHARGEDEIDACTFNAGVETPPRTWRGQACDYDRAIAFRNTSTHVERTQAD